MSEHTLSRRPQQQTKQPTNLETSIKKNDHDDSCTISPSNTFVNSKIENYRYSRTIFNETNLRPVGEMFYKLKEMSTGLWSTRVYFNGKTHET